jgi:hypothetical protein
MGEKIMELSKMAQYLPAREQIASSLGLRPARTPDAMLAIGLFGLGVLMGSAIALLLAPRSGAEMREELRCRMNAVRDRLRTNPPNGEDRESASA